RFLAPHAWKPIPAVRGIVCDGVGLTDPIRIPPLRYDEIIVRESAGVANCQRKRLHRIPDRSPDLHDGEPTTEQSVGLLWHEVTYALRSGPLGVIVMHTAYDLPDLLNLAQLVVRRAQGMVEYQHPCAAGIDNVVERGLNDIGQRILFQHVNH